ncbi:MAG: hypothetical protein ACK53L_03095, partial [Pirellulaceae bacterium]
MHPGGFAAASAADDGVEPGIQAKNGGGSPSQAPGFVHPQLTQDKRRRFGGRTRAWGPIDLGAAPTHYRTATAIAIQQREA